MAKFKDFLNEEIGNSITEGSTEDAKKTLDAILGFLKKQEKDLDDDGKEMLKMAQGFADHFAKEKSFSPAQAKWLFNTSKALKMH